MSTGTETDFLSKIDCLPPLPTIVQRVLAVTSSEIASASDVARILGQDPGVAAKVLRVANSPFYGVSRAVTQVTRAAAILGARGVRNLVLGICARDALMAGNPQNQGHATLWRHSVATAAGCELIARHTNKCAAEEAFVAGLLHDVGRLAMVAFAPELFEDVVARHIPESEQLELECKHFGAHHGEVGFKILGRWGLPDALCQAARRHHELDLADDPETERLVATVRLADAMAHVGGHGFDLPVAGPAEFAAAADVVQLNIADQAAVFAGLEARVAQVAETLDARAGETLIAPGDAPSTAAWVLYGDHPVSMCEPMLEQHGYAVQRVPDVTEPEQVPDADLTIVSRHAACERAEELARGLVARGRKRVALLREGSDAASERLCDETTGLCHMPEMFTAFDLKWLEERHQQ